MYINTKTKEYPVYRVHIENRKKGFDDYELVINTEQPIHNPLLQMLVELQPEEIDGKYYRRYEVQDRSQEDAMERVAKEAERAVQAHINTVVKGLGYDDENSIAKYLVEGNPFYDECKAISLWIGSVWAYTHQVQADVVAQTRTLPTTQELIAELPSLVI